MAKAPQKKKLSSAIETNVMINTSEDASFLEKETYNWDDLNTLKDELAQGVVNFIQNVESVSNRPEILENLGDDKNRFQKAVETFYLDLDDFSKKVKKNRMAHDGKTGKIEDLKTFDEYNRITLNYHALFQELFAIISPVVSDIMIMVTEAGNRIRQSTETSSVEETPGATAE